MEKLGTPCRLTLAVHKEIVEAIPLVIVFGQACEYAGTPRATGRTWLNRGDKERVSDIDSDYASFSLDVRKAQARVIRDLIKKGRKKNLWLLERCFREDFGINGEDIKLMGERMEQFQLIIDRMLKGSNIDISKLLIEGSQ